MSVLFYIIIALAGLSMVYLLHKQPKLAMPALVIAAVVAGVILLLGP